MTIKWRPTNALVTGVQQFHQRSRRALAVDEFSRRFIEGQLTQHAGCHALHVVHRRVEQLKAQREPLRMKNTDSTQLLVET